MLEYAEVLIEGVADRAVELPVRRAYQLVAEHIRRQLDVAAAVGPRQPAAEAGLLVEHGGVVTGLGNAFKGDNLARVVALDEVRVTVDECAIQDVAEAAVECLLGAEFRAGDMRVPLVLRLRKAPEIHPEVIDIESRHIAYEVMDILAEPADVEG